MKYGKNRNKKMDQLKRYSEEKIVLVTFSKLEKVESPFGLWYNYFTDQGDFFSTKYEELTKEIRLNEPLLICYVSDFKIHNFKRIMGVVQDTRMSTSGQLEGHNNSYGNYK